MGIRFNIVFLEVIGCLCMMSCVSMWSKQPNNSTGVDGEKEKEEGRGKPVKVGVSG